MSEGRDQRLWSIAKDALLTELLKDSDIDTRLSDKRYRDQFRLAIGDALHDRYDFSENIESPEAIADEILDVVIDVVKHYRKKP